VEHTGIGAKGADKILEMRVAKGDLELEDQSHVPYLRLTLLDSNSKSSRRVLRTDGDFDCPGADLLLYPLGLVSLKAASSSLCSSSNLSKCLDFTPFEDKEGLGERRGSLDERHRERVRSVDRLEEEWEGTGSRHPSGMGKDSLIKNKKQ
jgi:hypothetical protein